LEELARTMLNENSLPKYFWAVFGQCDRRHSKEGLYKEATKSVMFKCRISIPNRAKDSR